MDGEYLEQSLKHMSKTLSRSKMYTEVKGNLIGFLRSTEAMTNRNGDSYNQYIHILLCVESNYFKNKANYVTQEEWVTLRQKALQMNYRLVANIKAIEPDQKGDRDIRVAIKETSKYLVRLSDFLTDDDEKNQGIMNNLEKGLYRKRMLSYGSLLKQKHKILNLDGVEDGNLINTSDENKTTDGEEKAYSIMAIWNFGEQDYYLRNLKR